jgi:hypothetical protein
MRPWIRRLSLAVTAWAAGPAASAALELTAGGYLFSDELGGFRLLSASGAGTPDDPIVVVEEFDEAAPATLVIRRRPSAGDPRQPSYQPLTLEKIVVNRSRRIWAGFEVELQEVLKRPSDYGDGLSFNQYGAAPADVRSDAFAENERLFEPSDRIRFQSGHVDPETTARFRLTITDPTPIREFYLVQDPKLLSAGLPAGRSLAVRPAPKSADLPGRTATAMSP